SAGPRRRPGEGREGSGLRAVWPRLAPGIGTIECIIVDVLLLSNCYMLCLHETHRCSPEGRRQSAGEPECADRVAAECEMPTDSRCSPAVADGEQEEFMTMRLLHAARSAFVSTLAIAAALPGLARAEAPQDLVDAATEDGMLTVIALPHDWCNYGEVIAGFKAKYPGITVNELNPDAGTADELEAIRSNKGNTGSQAPDVVDLGLAFAPAATKEGLLQPYKVATWDEIPENIKDADG